MPPALCTFTDALPPEVYKPPYAVRNILLLDNSDSTVRNFWDERDPGRFVELNKITLGLFNALKLSGAPEKLIELKTLEHGDDLNRDHNNPIKQNADLSNLGKVDGWLHKRFLRYSTWVEPSILPEFVKYWDAVRAGFGAGTLQTSPPLPPSWTILTSNIFDDIDLVEEIIAINALLQFCYTDDCTRGREVGVYVCIVQIGDPALMKEERTDDQVRWADFSKNLKFYINMRSECTTGLIN